jgi:hypothetical protein
MLVLVGTVAEMTGLGAEEDLFSFFDMLLVSAWLLTGEFGG